MKVIWSEKAIDQIRLYAQLIQNDKPMAASKWIRSIMAKDKEIEEFPMLGRVVPEFNKTSVRECIFGSHRIIYRINETDILIVTVEHSKKLLDIEIEG